MGFISFGRRHMAKDEQKEGLIAAKKLVSHFTKDEVEAIKRELDELEADLAAKTKPTK